ncbi:cupin domain-containing protein [Streptomyces sp. NPDC005244]|uniref:cupin domain-containing protein n=1 Tax=Streptomyces sp. NPDC005244 TaxID=3364708 RepID=UPI003689A815
MTTEPATTELRPGTPDFSDADTRDGASAGAVAHSAARTAEIRTDIPRFLPVAGHHEPAPFYLTADMFGGVPVELAGGAITHLVGKPVADPHRHTVDEIYFLVSPNPGGARIDVLVDGERHELTSPALLRVPAGAEHRFLTLEAEPGSYCFGLLLGSER